MEASPADHACPTCGQRFAQSVDVCPNCGRDGANPFVSPVVEEVHRDQHWRWIAAVATGVCILCLALAFVAPGLAVLLLVLASPVLARAWAEIERRREAGLPINVYRRLQAIGLSGALLLLALLAGAIACLVVCVPMLLFLTIPWGGSSVGPIVALISGGIAALAMGVHIMRRHWPKRIDKAD